MPGTDSNVPHTGHSQLLSENTSDRPFRTAGNTAAGHAFAQPRARLGRPVPLPGAGQEYANEKVNSSAVSGPARELQNRVWNEADSARVLIPEREPPGWQFGPENSTPWSGVDQSAGRNLSNTHAGADETNGLQSSLRPDSENRSVADAIETVKPNSASPDSSSDMKSPAPNGPSPPNEVPTMLGRLRELYNPRIDDSTDRLRKQIRRWPDPFGLLKDRDDTVTSPAYETPRSTAELNEENSGDNTIEEQVPQSEKFRSDILAVIAELEEEIANWPRKPSGKPDHPAEWRQRQTDLRLLYMIAGRSAESVRIIESLPEEEQEYWQSLMLSINGYRMPGEDSSRVEQLTESLEHLRTAARRLQPLSQLSLRRMMLCDRIDGFGNVAAFPTSNFEPGQRILVYSELQNFRSELTADGKYRSEFAAVIEFMREGDDEVVETIRVSHIEDVCDTERTDYFVSFELTLPALEGKYVMRLRLRDQLSLRTAESSLEFTVRSGK